MIKYFVLLIVIGSGIFISSCHSTSRKDVKDQGMGRLVFEEEMHNFGSVNYGDVLGYSFKCWNKGEGNVVINDVKLSCGCTEVNYSKEPIQPGDSLFFEVVFDSKGFSGRQVKKVTVIANDSTKVHDLFIWADVKN